MLLFHEDEIVFRNISVELFHGFAENRVFHVQSTDFSLD